MQHLVKKFAFIAAAGSLLVTPTIASAAQSSAPANGWVALSEMNPLAGSYLLLRKGARDYAVVELIG